MTAVKRTPSINGVAAARDLLFHGLAVNGALMSGVEGSDIAKVRFGRRQVFLLTHPDYVDHVLHEAADRYHKSIEYEMLRAALGLNLFTDEDESWRRHRMLLNPVLAKRHLVDLCDLMIDPIEAFVADLDAGPLEMTEAMTELTLDVVGAALFGRELGDLARKLKRAVTDALRTAEVAARLSMVLDPPVWVARACAAFVHYAPLMPPPLSKAQYALKTIDRTVWETIRHRESNPVDTADLLGLLLSVRDEHGRRLPMRRVRDEATTFMLAGHETTANALAWMWYLLALNTPARDRMLDEVDAALGGRRPTVADLRALPWTTACFQEAMRMLPPAWVIPRECVQEDEIDGHRIPRGSTVVIPVHHIHHDARFWPEPETFDPNRFLAENARGRHRSAYLPFGGGRRICIGSSFALMETTLITAMMSQAYVYDLVPGHPVEAEATLTLRPRHGLEMTVHARQPSAVGAAA